LAGELEVAQPIEAHAHRALRDERAERSDRRVGVGLRLLAPEAAAHAQLLHDDLRLRHAADARDDLLRLGRMLRGAVHEDRTSLVDEGERGLGLEVEVLLATDVEGALEAMRRGGERTLGLAATD